MRTSPDAPDARPAQRIDKWLWFARLLKSRTLAQALAESGRIRVSRAGSDTLRITRASHLLRVGDVLTFPLGTRVRVVRMCAPGARRGPPAEARSLYEDLSPAKLGGRAPEAPAPGRPKGSGRPTKRDRRALDRLRGGAI
jgi:ribosome-associated heat shock protein Hsp15